jgi:hypothetical protein
METSKKNSSLLEFAKELRLECVTKEKVTEKLKYLYDLDKVLVVAHGELEGIKREMRYAGTRKELLEVCISLMDITKDLEFLIECIHENKKK